MLDNPKKIMRYKHKPVIVKPNLGSIHADEFLPLQVISSRLGWKRSLQQQATRTGLKTIQYGNLKYCFGSDVHEFFRNLAKKTSEETDY
jgi:hypothetical protein